MTRLIARLVLSMLLLPLTGAAFLLGMVMIIPTAGQPTVGGLLALWSGLYLFIGTYWVGVWRSVIRWTPRRIAGTLLAAPGAIGLGAAVGAIFWHLGPGVPVQIAMLVGGGFVPIAWVLATVIIWRESAAERAARIAAIGAGGVCCPVCGYNLTGLREARCPECGTAFTLEQLLSASLHNSEATPPGG